MSGPEIRDAATLVALRDSANGPELLMMERTGKAVFAGGCWVFPGGATEESDWDSGWKTQTQELPDCAAESEACVKERRALRITAVREAIEEASIAFTDPLLDQVTINQLRDDLNAGHTGFLEWCAANRVTLPLDRLLLWSQWVTPRGERRRFNARFYLADFTGIATQARADGEEAVAIRWITAADALSESERNQFRLMFPTVRQLLEIRDFTTVADLLAWASAQNGVEPVHSRFRINDRGRLTGISLPGDADYDDCVDEISPEQLPGA